MHVVPLIIGCDSLTVGRRVLLIQVGKENDLPVDLYAKENSHMTYRSLDVQIT